MTAHSAPPKANQSGRSLLWVMTLLSALLLGFVTYTAIRNNPLYSDRDAYGISKYKLIEACKEQLHEGEKLNLSLQGQQVPLGTLIGQSGQLRPGETLLVKTAADSATLVSGVQEVASGKLGLATPVIIAAMGQGGAQRALGQAQMQCVHDRATDKTDVVLSAGQ